LWNTSSTNFFSSTEMRFQRKTDLSCSNYEFLGPHYCEVNVSLMELTYWDECPTFQQRVCEL
jgi:hypothetical protein